MRLLSSPALAGSGETSVLQRLLKNRPLIRALLAGQIALVLAACAVGAPAAGAKVAKGPSGLAFYEPPKELPSGEGKPIWARRATGLVPLEGAAWTKNVLYTSTTPQGKQIAVSGSVSVPEGRPPKNGWPLISYAHGTVGVADICAPSRNRADGPAVDYISYVNPQLEEWIAAGYAVARTDYQGLGTPGPSPYLVGASEGRGVVDIVLAARRLGPEIRKQYLIAGHSQGGQGALFAAGMAQRKAPGLRLRGTVAYAPASHLTDQAKLLPVLTEPSPISAEATMIVEGASTVSRDVDPSRLLADDAFALYPELERTCLPQLQQPDSLGGIAPADLLREGADTTGFYRVLRQANPDVNSKAPIFLAQGSADSTVLPMFTDQLETELADAYNRVRYTVYEGVDHGGIVAAAEDDALAFFRSRVPPG